MKRVIDWFCEGAVDEVLVGMVDGAMLDGDQLQMLADKIARVKAAKR